MKTACAGSTLALGASIASLRCSARAGSLHASAQTSAAVPARRLTTAGNLRARDRRVRRMELRDRHAVITGGTGGIGQALVRRFAEEGARVAVADRDRDSATRLAEEVGGLG